MPRRRGGEGGTDHLSLDVVVRVEADCLGEYAAFLGDLVEVEAREPDRDVLYCPVHQRVRNTVIIIRPGVLTPGEDVDRGRRVCSVDGGFSAFLDQRDQGIILGLSLKVN